MSAQLDARQVAVLNRRMLIQLKCDMDCFDL